MNVFFMWLSIESFFLSLCFVRIFITVKCCVSTFMSASKAENWGSSGSLKEKWENVSDNSWIGFRHGENWKRSKKLTLTSTFLTQRILKIIEFYFCFLLRNFTVLGLLLKDLLRIQVWLKDWHPTFVYFVFSFIMYKWSKFNLKWRACYSNFIFPTMYNLEIRGSQFAKFEVSQRHLSQLLRNNENLLRTSTWEF